MLNSESGRKVIANIPNDKILIETDSPFTSIDGNIFRPTDIWGIIEGIAIIKKMSREDSVNLLWDNFKNLISI